MCACWLFQDKKLSGWRSVNAFASHRMWDGHVVTKSSHTKTIRTQTSVPTSMIYMSCITFFVIVVKLIKFKLVSWYHFLLLWMFLQANALVSSPMLSCLQFLCSLLCKILFFLLQTLTEKFTKLETSSCEEKNVLVNQCKFQTFVGSPNRENWTTLLALYLYWWLLISFIPNCNFYNNDSQVNL